MLDIAPQVTLLDRERRYSTEEVFELLDAFRMSIEDAATISREVLRLPMDIVPGPIHDSLLAFEIDAGLLLPTFQLDADRRPLDLVLKINQLLLITESSWTAAYWWAAPQDEFAQQRPVDLLTGPEPDGPDQLQALVDSW